MAIKNIPQSELNETPAERTGRLGHWMEQVIEEARKDGLFDNLPGKGKPLSLGEASDPFAGPEADLYRTLKQAGFTPEWVDLRKQIVAEINWLRANPNSPERASRIVEANVRIDRHNRLIPTPSLNLPKLPRDFGRA